MLSCLLMTFSPVNLIIGQSCTFEDRVYIAGFLKLELKLLLDLDPMSLCVNTG